MEKFRINIQDEYTKLKSVVLMIPRSPDVVEVDNPKAVMFQEKPNHEKLYSELQEYATLLRSLGIEVFSFYYNKYPNQVFVRDLAVVHDSIIYLAQPKYEIRHGEQLELYSSMKSAGFLSTNFKISSYHMEGADYLRLSKNFALLCMGNRTKNNFARYITACHVGLTILEEQANPEGVPQHILGHKHIVDNDVILSRHELNSNTYLYGHVIKLGETKEIVERYAMNVLTVAPMEIVMADDCPETKARLEAEGIICHTAPMGELRKMGGGFACATLPICREGGLVE